MINYRGVAKDDVIRSLRNGAAFLRRLNMGQETATIADKWLANSSYDAIAEAEDNAALAGKMNETGAAWAFLRLGRIFQHHAAMNTGGAGREIYDDLNEWGAFSGAMTLDYRSVDLEEDIHLILQYAWILAQEDPGLSVRAQRRMDEVLDEFRRNNDPAQYGWIDRDIVDIVEAVDNADPLMATQDILHHDLHWRHVVRTALFHASGLDDKIAGLESKTAFDCYGIWVENLPRQFAEMKIVLDPLMEKAQEILEPFYGSDEVQMSGYGSITEDREKLGIMFHITHRAARALANAMPDAHIINYKGERIMPEPPALPDAPRP